MKPQLAIGVDVGGSHVSCAACDLTLKKYLPETLSENKLDNQGTAAEITDIWAETIGETIRKSGNAGITGIGFAMPGPFDYLNGIALFKGNNRKYEGLYGLDVPEALRRVLGLQPGFPVRFINDATAFAIGEDWFGKAAGTTKSLSITLGTGFGSAFLRNHMPVVTGSEVPETGAVWHLPFENGNADDYFSTRGLIDRYRIQTGRTLSGVKELAQLASGDPVARSLFEDFGTKLGLFLKPWIGKFGVEVLVIGGNISHAFHLFGNSLQYYLETNSVHIRVEISELKESASIIGSAVLSDENFYQQLKPLLADM